MLATWRCPARLAPAAEDADQPARYDRSFRKVVAELEMANDEDLARLLSVSISRKVRISISVADSWRSKWFLAAAWVKPYAIACVNRITDRRA